jgi:anion-transporting  ArsA/GET3 family ATPase
VIPSLAGHRVVVCCGAGGVGKTTVSAALGLAAAMAGEGRVLVLTVDPARRLATALGLGALGSRPVAISRRRLAAAGAHTRGELQVAMLDMKSEWDRMVERNAPSAAVRDRILASPFYKGISTAFTGSQEYIALEALFNLHASGHYDLIVVDTPPSRDALAFLDAPERITDFVAARLLTWLAGPSQIGWRAFNLAATPFLKMADRLLGGEVLEDLASFVRDLQTLYSGISERARAVSRLLRSESTAFAVVSTLEAQPLAEARFFCAGLRERSLPLRALILNRVLPAELLDPEAAASARRLLEEPSGSEPGEAFLLLNALAEAEADRLRELTWAGRTEVARLPMVGRRVGDLAAVAALAHGLEPGAGDGDE